MPLQFDTPTVLLFVSLALLIGYAAGAIRASLGGHATPSAPMRPLTRRERDDVITLLAAGKAVDAIRSVRELTGTDLEQAHAAVRRLEVELGPRVREE